MWFDALLLCREIINNFLTVTPHFHSVLGPAYCVASFMGKDRLKGIGQELKLKEPLHWILSMMARHWRI